MSGARKTGPKLEAGERGHRRSAETRGEYEGYLSKLTKEAGFTFFGRIFALLFGFIASAIIARVLGPDVLGVYVLAWAVVLAATILTTFGFEGSFVKYISIYVAQGKSREARAVYMRGIHFGVIAALIATAAIVFLRRPIAYTFFKEPRLERALLFMALAMVPYTLTRLQAAGLRALKDMKRSIIGAEFGFRIPRLTVFLVLYYVGLKYHRPDLGLLGVVLASVAASITSALVTFVYLKKSGPYLFDHSRKAEIPTGELVRYSASMLAETATAFALLEGSRLILGFFLESTEVGIYNIVVLLAMIATLFTFSFNAIFSPIIADIYHRGRIELMKSLLTAITRWIVLLTLPVYGWIILSGEAVLGIFGNEFVRGYPALVILATAQLLNSTAGSIASCLAMTKYQRYNVYNTMIMAVVSVGLNIWLIPRMGIVGAAIATACSIVLINIARLVEGRLLLEVMPYDRSTLKVVATGALLVAAALLLRGTPLAPTTWYWAGAALAASYAVAFGLTAVMGIREEDRMVIRAVLQKVLHTR
jgi:O-antigen/teichoic acid export membrane protein